MSKLSKLIAPRFHKRATDAINFQNTINNATSGLSSVKKGKRASVEIARKVRDLSAKDIGDLRAAQQVAINYEKPRRSLLYDIYDDTLIDGHLKGLVKVRVESLLKTNFFIKDSATGEIDEEATKLLKKSWFWKYMTYSWNANLFGFSYIEFDNMIQSTSGIVDYEFCKVKEVNRRNVIPEQGIIVKEVNDDKGIDYRSGFKYWAIEIGEEDDLGMLFELSFQTIPKKYSGIYWDEFAERFGIPLVVGKTNEVDVQKRGNISDMLQTLGSSGYAVLGKEDDIEIVESKHSDSYMVYDKRMERCDKEISKLILGNTMTTDNGSSKSQGEVHFKVSQIFFDSDKREIGFNINEKLIPFMIHHGYPMEGKEFVWDTDHALSKLDQMKIDEWLLDHFDIEAEYFKKKYNASIIDYKKTPAVATANEPGK